jgi:predicted transcriptional regulator
LNNTATLLGISRATVSKVMSAYINHGKTVPLKRNSGQTSTLTERDHRTLRRIVSKNNRTTAAQVAAELNMYSSRRPCFHKNCPRASQSQHAR